jgi:hypothetical protein
VCHARACEPCRGWRKWSWPATERIVRSSNGKEKMEPQPAPVSPAAVACSGCACPASGATPAGGGARRGARHPPWRRAAPVKGSRTEPHVCACAAHARLLFSSGRACTHAGGWCGCDAHCHCSRLTSLLPLHGTQHQQQPALRGPHGPAGAVSMPNTGRARPVWLFPVITLAVNYDVKQSQLTKSTSESPR